VHNFKATGVDERFWSVGTSAAVELSASSLGHVTSGGETMVPWIRPVCPWYKIFRARVLKNTINEYNVFCFNPQLKCKS
jgi:hypothetical protein